MIAQGFENRADSKAGFGRLGMLGAERRELQRQGTPGRLQRLRVGARIGQTVRL
jgi:hypothetical protein